MKVRNTDSKQPCSSACGYGSREDDREDPKPRESVLVSTRIGRPGSDEHRDMDGYDVDEDLARLRLALQDPTFAGADASPIARFVARAFGNLDEHLVRQGDRPRAWYGKGTREGPRSQAKDAQLTDIVDGYRVYSKAYEGWLAGDAAERQPSKAIRKRTT